jgi:hypothetical protein
MQQCPSRLSAEDINKINVFSKDAEVYLCEERDSSTTGMNSARDDLISLLSGAPVIEVI